MSNEPCSLVIAKGPPLPGCQFYSSCREAQNRTAQWERRLCGLSARITVWTGQRGRFEERQDDSPSASNEKQVVERLSLSDRNELRLCGTRRCNLHPAGNVCQAIHCPSTQSLARSEVERASVETSNERWSAYSSVAGRRGRFAVPCPSPCGRWPGRPP